MEPVSGEQFALRIVITALSIIGFFSANAIGKSFMDYNEWLGRRFPSQKGQLTLDQNIWVARVAMLLGFIISSIGLIRDWNRLQ